MTGGREQEYVRPADHEKRLTAARKWATWYLGHPQWADDLICAYENPEAASQRVDRERAS